MKRKENEKERKENEKDKEYVRKLGKWGNSVVTGVPKPLLDELGLERADWVCFSLVDGKMVLEARRRPRRQELVAGITADNQHDEDLEATPRGESEENV